MIIFRYQNEQLREVELVKKRRKDMEDAKTAMDEEDRKEKERLMLSHQWELQRRLRDTKVLCNLEQLHKQAKINEIKNFREVLDIQCVSKNYIFMHCIILLLHTMVSIVVLFWGMRVFLKITNFPYLFAILINSM